MTTATDISKYDDIIDSRDVIARIEELEVSIEYDREAGDPVDEEETAELKALLELQEEAEGYAADWKYGEALIRDSYFVDYAQQLAEDIGAINPDASWPNSCIDWERAAKELQMDYTAVEFDGVTYWIR
jgi:hypothetical protein